MKTLNRREVASFCALANAIPSLDAHTGAHLHHASCLAEVVATACGVAPDDPLRAQLALAARLQGLGKLMIPDEILDKPAALSAEDWREVRRHPEFAASLIRAVPSLASAADIVLARYEWWDGSGYPHALAGAAIPWSARLLAVAGSIDAMAARRAYRDARAPLAILQQLQQGRGSQFDPTIVDGVTEAFDQVTDVLQQGCSHGAGAPNGLWGDERESGGAGNPTAPGTRRAAALKSALAMQRAGPAGATGPRGAARDARQSTRD